MACLKLLVHPPHSSIVGGTDWIVFLAPKHLECVPDTILDDYACSRFFGFLVGYTLLDRGQVVGERCGCGRRCGKKFKLGMKDSGIKRGGYVGISAHWNTMRAAA